MKISKETIQQTGYYTELTGNFILTAASIVGIVAIPIVLIAAEQKNNRNYSQPVVIVRPPISFFNPWQPQYLLPQSNSTDFINGFVIFSIISSVIGVALAISLDVPWVGALIGGLWLTGFAVKCLGQHLQNYANEMDDEVVIQQPLMSGVSSNPFVIEHKMASAPPLELEPGEQPSHNSKFCSI